MCVTVVTLSCALLAQAAADGPLVSVEPAESQTSTADLATEAADLMAEALTMPEGAALTGRPMTLLRALSSVRGGQERLEVPHAYWRLTLAVAEYRSRFEENDQLGRIEAQYEDGMLLETARASAAAELQMAELRVVSAQHDLAEAAELPATASLPLPADPPLVGVYLTKFEEVRLTRKLPDRARLIDRSLPIRRQAIEARTSAVRASQDVLQARYEAYQSGRADFADVLLSLRQWGKQHRAFLATVCNYNHDIANYALSVADLQMDERVLVAMLIRPSEESPQTPVPEVDSGQMGQPTVVRQPSAVRPATFDEPISTPSQGGLQSMGQGKPTRAPPRKAEEPEATGEGPSATPKGKWEGSVPTTPTPSPPSEEAASVEPEEAASVEPEEAETGEPEVSEAPRVPVPEGAESDISQGVDVPAVSVPEEIDSDQPETSDPPRVPVQPDPAKTTPRTVNKQPLTDPQGAQGTYGLYSGLFGLEPAVRAKRLTEYLHSGRTLPESTGESIELQQCLAASSVADRRQVIAAYWLAAERAAKYQALAAQVTFLEELEPTAMEQRNEPLGAGAMLALRAAKLAAQADLLAARLNLLEAQFQLTRRTGRPQEGSWLLPTTIPHYGRYDLKLDAQPKELAESWPVRRLAVTIPAFSENLQQRAAVVVGADDTRAATTVAYRAGSQPITAVLASIAHQTEETFAFLETLTEHNEAIADYALRVLPSTVRGEQLAGSLVVIR